MYNKVECITLTCDNCQETYIDDDGTGFSVFIDKDVVHEYAENAGWYLHGDDGKHYCPDCHTIDDEDNLVIKNKP